MRRRSSLTLTLLSCFLFLGSNAHASDWALGNFFDIFRSQPTPVEGAPEHSIEQLRHFPTLVAELELLHANLVALHALAVATGMKVTTEQMLWKEILDKKVLRQFRARKALGIVVAGGTKTGKSTVFNHLAGREISSISHISGATKQAVLVVPKALYDLQVLQLLYPDMELVVNATPEDATVFTGKRQQLLVRSMDGLPDDTMFIDIPDVDSDVETNWEKAYAVTRSSDVVVAMITPEKHGDRATTQFFKNVAAQAGKPIVVVINKVHQSQIDEKQWVDWLDVFCKNTSINPIAAYVVPFDMKASQAGKQKFLRVEGDLTKANEGSGSYQLATEPSVLRDDIAKLNVDTLKAQAQIGALMQALEGEQGGDNPGKGGIVAYLNLIRKRTATYRSTLQGFRTSTQDMANTWPTPPKAVILNAIGEWWEDKHRWGLTKSAMNLVELATLGFLGKKAERLQKDKDILEYQQLQDVAVDDFVGRQFNALSPVVGESLHFLSPDNASLIGPLAQGRLLAALKTAYRKDRNPNTDFGMVAGERLPKWQVDNPGAMALIHSADVLAHVVVAPVLTVSGIVAGMVAPAAIAGGAASNAGTSAVGSVLGSLTSGKVNEAVDSMGTSLGVSALFHDFGLAYATIQLNWINDYVTTQHLAPMLAELEKGAAVEGSEAFRDSAACAERIATWARGFGVPRS